GFPCRQLPLNVYFENGRAVLDHQQCNPAVPEGCHRCALPTSWICCDLHNPTPFNFFKVSPQKSDRLPPWSRLVLGYKMVGEDHQLREALDNWWEKATAARYGWAHLHDLGPTLIMPNEVLNRIIDCAHYHKINSTSELKNETRWDEIEQCGDEVLEIIQCLRPQVSAASPLTTTPLRTLPTPIRPSTPALNLASPNLPTSTTTANHSKSRCSTCGLVGHNGKFMFGLSMEVIILRLLIWYSTQSDL
ncbi:hypothetical protein L208DRAFT_1341853, partial [Tricholoma matsutake]